MNHETRDLDNLTEYLMRAPHAQLVTFTSALGRELTARGLPGDVLVYDVARELRGRTSTARAEPLARPA